MNTVSTSPVRQQNFMHALRSQMGLPLHQLVNDVVAFTFGQPMDMQVGLEMARIAQMIQKDAVYVSFANDAARRPSGYSVIYRELHMVDVIDNCVPYAASDGAPVVLVSTRADEQFAIDSRGSLIRLQGKPSNIAAGRKLAMQRILAAAAKMGDAQMASCQIVRPGDAPIAQKPLGESIVCFS